MKIGKISAKIHEIGKIKAIFGLGMTPICGLKNGQIKSLGSFGKHLKNRQIRYQSVGGPLSFDGIMIIPSFK